MLRSQYHCFNGRWKRKRMGDVKVGDEVVTFDVNTCETSITKVINQYVRPTDKKIYKITTVSGRGIIAMEIITL